MINPRQHCWAVEVEDHEDMGKVERDIRTRLSGYEISISNITFMYPPIYFTM